MCGVCSTNTCLKATGGLATRPREPPDLPWTGQDRTASVPSSHGNCSLTCSWPEDSTLLSLESICCCTITPRTFHVHRLLASRTGSEQRRGPEVGRGLPPPSGEQGLHLPG